LQIYSVDGTAVESDSGSRFGSEREGWKNADAAGSGYKYGSQEYLCFQVDLENQDYNHSHFLRRKLTCR
jgi:hypothetical protein